MKKRFYSLTLIMLLLVAINANAADYLYVLGKSISLTGTTNAIGSEYLSKGSISYNATTRELTLDNVQASTATNSAVGNAIFIRANVKDLVVIVKGTCDITTTNSFLYTYNNTTIKGYASSSKLNVNCIGPYAFSFAVLTYNNNVDFTFRSLELTSNQLEASSSNYTSAQNIQCTFSNNYSGNITFNDVKATLNRKGNEYTSAIQGFKTTTFTACGISVPSGAYFENGYLYDDYGRTDIGTVKLERGATATTPYPLYVFGKRVTSWNATNVGFGAAWQSLGKVVYDLNNNKLTFTGLTYDCPNTEPVIKYEGTATSLNVEVSGNNKITNKGPILETPETTRNINFTGASASAKFYAKSTNSSCIYLTGNNQNLTFTNGNYEFLTSRNAVLMANKNSTGTSLNFVNCNAHIENDIPSLGYVTYAFAGFANVTTTDCTITTPVNLRWDKEDRSPWIGDALYYNGITIEVDGKLYVTGKKVTEANSGSGAIVQGVSFDKNTSTLTLNNVNYKGSTTFISSSLRNLTIKVVGTNNVEANNFLTVTDLGNVVIDGGGTATLNAIGKSSGFSNFYFASGETGGGNCTIKDMKSLVSNSESYGFVGKYGGSTVLTLQNSTGEFKRNTTSGNSVVQLNRLLLIDTKLTNVNYSNTSPWNGGRNGSLQFEATGSTDHKGDINGDGLVNASDVTTLINMILGIIPQSASHGDINTDGSVNTSDVTELINIILSK